MTAHDRAAALALIARLTADLDTLRRVLGEDASCPLAAALADVFASSPFTSAEVIEAGARQAASAARLGQAPAGLAAALADARITTPHGFGRWAARAPGIARAASERGAALWVVVSKPRETPRAHAVGNVM